MIALRSSHLGRGSSGLERAGALSLITMTQIEARAIVKAAEAAKKAQKLTYRGVAYLKKNA